MVIYRQLKKAIEQEERKMTKFENIAKVAKNENPSDECHYLTFKRWEKNGKSRIYINDYKRRTLGYIDMANGETIITDNQGNSKTEIDYALNGFKANYEY